LQQRGEIQNFDDVEQRRRLRSLGIAMEVVAARIADLDPEDFKEERESTDRTRSNDHNAFISSVDAVNKICDAHGVPRIYTGGTERRAYGDFAMELIADIFEKRH
jgi:hypothetical protein